MRPEPVPFSNDHLDAAAELLAMQRRIDREQAPALPEFLEDPIVIRRMLLQMLRKPRASGVVVDAGHFAGFLIGVPSLVSPTELSAQLIRPRSVRVEYIGHAVTPSGQSDLLHQLYAALASQWILQGLFTHYVTVSALDSPGIDAWVGLGFGQEVCLAVRKTGMSIEGESDGCVALRPSRAGDEDGIVELATNLFRSFAEPPMFMPHPPEILADLQNFQRAVLADDRNVHWLALVDDRIVAFVSFIVPTSPVWFVPLSTVPEQCVYLFEAYTVPEWRGRGIGTALLQRAMRWAADAGYPQCAVNFLTASAASRFWRSQGFEPLLFQLYRQVDERIAWAHGRM